MPHAINTLESILRCALRDTIDQCHTIDTLEWQTRMGDLSQFGENSDGQGVGEVVAWSALALAVTRFVLHPEKGECRVTGLGSRNFSSSGWWRTRLVFRGLSFRAP
eukprot:1079436-Amphidinium_carterae.1